MKEKYIIYQNSLNVEDDSIEVIVMSYLFY